jgi:hypothetical protein
MHFRSQTTVHVYEHAYVNVHGACMGNKITEAAEDLTPRN